MVRYRFGRSKLNSGPTETHMKAACHLLRYLKGTKDYSTTYGNAQNSSIV